MILAESCSGFARYILTGAGAVCVCSPAAWCLRMPAGHRVDNR